MVERVWRVRSATFRPMQRDGMNSDEPINDSLDLALRVGNVLESLGCDYFVGGSVASSLHGEPRATNDIDFVVAMRPQRVQAFAEQAAVNIAGIFATGKHSISLH